MLQVYLVRHGETQWNAERRIQGHSDSPLTEKGEQQAWQVAERAKALGITHIIASDLGRTRRTAEIIAELCGCDITLDSRLRELDMGVLEKRNLETLTEEEVCEAEDITDGKHQNQIYDCPPDGTCQRDINTDCQKDRNQYPLINRISNTCQRSHQGCF